MKYIFKERHYNIPDEELLSDLRKTADEFGSNYVPSSYYKVYGRFSTTCYLHRFGSWNIALKKAGLEIGKNYNYTDDELLSELKRVWDSLGRQPMYAEIKKPVSNINISTYVDRYGSWPKVISAFFDYLKIKRKIAVKLPKQRYKKPVRKRKPANYLPVNKSMRFDIMNRDNFRCVLCGASPANDRKVKLHVDHIIPVSKGGRSRPDNLQTLCKDCNYGKRNKTMNNVQ